MKNFFSFIVISFFLILSSLKAQEGFEFGAFAGVSTYYGDLNPLFSFKRIGPSAGLMARKNFDGRICLRATLNYLNVGGDDSNSLGEWEKKRNLNFFSHVVEGAFAVEFNFQDFHSKTREDKPIAPYIVAGLGFFYFDPQTVYQGQNYQLRSLGTEGQIPGEEYAPIAPCIQLGGGVKVDINRNWSLNLEINGRVTFTDFLDDVSGKYADLSLVEGYRGAVGAALSDRSVEIGPRLGETGRQRGDSKTNDSYVTINFGFAYRFLPLSCPTY